MATAWVSDDVSIHPGIKENEIVIQTARPLTDQQVQDLYWVVLGMSKTGRPLTDLISGCEGRGCFYE